MAVEFLSRKSPVVAGNVHVQLRVGVEHRHHLVYQGRSIVHYVDAKAGMTNQHFLEEKWTRQTRAVLWGAEVCSAGRALTHVDADRNVQLFGQSEIRLQ